MTTLGDIVDEHLKVQVLLKRLNRVIQSFFQEPVFTEVMEICLISNQQKI